MNLYFPIIKHLLSTEEYNKYNHVIDQQFLKENYPETYRVYQSLTNLHSNPGVYSVDDLSLRFFTDYPNANQNEYKGILDSIRDSSAQSDQIVGFLTSLRERERASQIAKHAIGIAEGRGSLVSLQELINTTPIVLLPSSTDDFIDDSLSGLHQSSYLTSGLRWRLGSLNQTLGSLRIGDFGFVFARPETGKTTFLTSEGGYMAVQAHTQGKGPLLWFNNEEQGGKVQERCYQAVLGLDRVQLFSNIERNQARYRELVGNGIRIIRDGSLSYKEIEAIIEREKPSLLIFDQIDKIKGFHEDRNDLELKAIYIWAREIAKKYAPVIAVCQAGGSGENKRWLTMNDVDNSKTGKQGEADWILGIGKVHDEGLESVRYLHLSKNKLPGDADTDSSRRHDQWEVKIVPEIARYEDWS